MELSLAAEIYNISKFYIPQDDHYDLAKDTVRCLIDLSYADYEITRAFADNPEISKALADYASETSGEDFGGDYYEYLNEDM